MNKLLAIILGVGLVLTMCQAVLAVGGGSGGSTITCTSDTWSCSSYSACSSDGSQVRRCTLTYDCPTATTPKPSEQQSCTPTITNTGSTNQSGATNSCTADTWTCTDWSATCDTHGRQQRTCTVTVDCPSATTPPPEEFQQCQQVQCGNKPTMRERILCRLSLAPDGLARELAIQYLPEECRVKTDVTAQQECVQYYKNYQPCWTQPVGKQRISCARNVLKLGPVISTEVKTCRGKTGQDQIDCKHAIREKVLDLIKFRFYDLEQRAEDLGNHSVDLGTIADFVNAVELKKQAFNQATTLNDRRRIILDVRQLWNSFVTMAKTQLK